MWHYHNTIGAMDGKHVAIKKPAKSGSAFWNYKKFNSIILMGLVNAQYKFLWIDIGANGSCGDSTIWNDSDLKSAIRNDTLGLLPLEPLPNNDIPMPYHIIADDPFALSTTVMKPFSQCNLTREQQIYNYRLSRVRRCVENAFGILANRWTCLQKTLPQNHKTVSLITHACIVLHNLLREHYPNINIALADREAANGEFIPGTWM